MDTKVVLGISVLAAALAGTALFTTKPTVEALEERVAAAEAKVATLTDKVNAATVSQSQSQERFENEMRGKIDALEIYAKNKPVDLSSPTSNAGAAARDLVDTMATNNPLIAEEFPYRFELKQCKRQPKVTTVKCRVSLTNISDTTRKLFIHINWGPATVMVDENEVSYAPKEGFAFATEARSYINGELAPKLAQAVVLTYEDVDKSAKFASMQMSLTDQTDGNQRATVAIGPTAIIP